MKVKLTVLSGKLKGKQIPLPSSVFLIGRSEKCHLRPHSSSSSKLHCGIGRQSGQVVVRDMRSKNGTFINGEKITKAIAVQHGDTLSIGRHQFQFEITIEEDDSGIQHINEHDVHWLMNSPRETITDATFETKVIQIPPEFLELQNDDDALTEEDVADVGDSHILSAGDYLIDYLNPPLQEQGSDIR